jgi:hypothetical protein
LYLGLFAAGKNMFGVAPCREAIFVADAALFCILPPAPHKKQGGRRVLNASEAKG